MPEGSSGWQLPGELIWSQYCDCHAELPLTHALLHNLFEVHKLQAGASWVGTL